MSGEFQFLIYQSADEDVSVNAVIRDETIWLTQKSMAELFDVDVPAISKHLTNIYADGELMKDSTISKMEIVQQEGARHVKREQNFYNLDAIISVGYRVNSRRATQFRIWATSVLKEYMIKGFAMDDERLKQGKTAFGKDYFRELLERVRSIRASERRIWQQITDIFAECSIDYDKNAQITHDFYAMVQNKFHYAIVGQTAAEIVYSKADRTKENMGLTTWKNAPDGRILKSDVVVAKNYLEEKQINYIDWVPSALCIVVNTGALENFRPSYLKKIMFCGEAMPTKQFNQWREKYPDAMFANIYGPTETTVDCTYYIVDRDFADDEPLPIGYGCRNTDVFLLNGDRLAAEGESGELCVRGRCLALGYYNNPEKTAEAFIQNPLNPYYPEKIYKTGDIAKYNERGEIVFLARKDHQIKHMGHRIELGEIETAVNSIEGIETGVCLYDEGTQRILLFYCGTEETTQAYILKCLRDKVPKYMFPNLMLKLEKIPQTLNGKIDRLALKEYYDNDKQNT